MNRKLNRVIKRMTSDLLKSGAVDIWEKEDEAWLRSQLNTPSGKRFVYMLERKEADTCRNAIMYQRSGDVETSNGYAMGVRGLTAYILTTLAATPAKEGNTTDDGLFIGDTPVSELDT